jgi:hypothetical protein
VEEQVLSRVVRDETKTLIGESLDRTFSHAGSCPDSGAIVDAARMKFTGFTKASFTFDKTVAKKLARS